MITRLLLSALFLLMAGGARPSDSIPVGTTANLHLDPLYRDYVEALHIEEQRPNLLKSILRLAGVESEEEAGVLVEQLLNSSDTGWAETVLKKPSASAAEIACALIALKRHGDITFTSLGSEMEKRGADMDASFYQTTGWYEGLELFLTLDLPILEPEGIDPLIVRGYNNTLEPEEIESLEKRLVDFINRVKSQSGNGSQDDLLLGEAVFNQTGSLGHLEEGYRSASSEESREMLGSIMLNILLRADRSDCEFGTKAVTILEDMLGSQSDQISNRLGKAFGVSVLRHFESCDAAQLATLKQLTNYGPLYPKRVGLYPVLAVPMASEGSSASDAKKMQQFGNLVDRERQDLVSAEKALQTYFSSN